MEYATNASDHFQQLMKKAQTYHEKAFWEHKLRVLQEALELCTKPGFPNANQCEQQVLYDIGGIRRRLGQYKVGVETLNRALNADKSANSLMRARIKGELGVMFRHSNDFNQAQQTFKEQYDLARNLSIEAEAEMCRAIGNEGMSAYNRSQQSMPTDTNMLEIAFKQIQERVDRAENLHKRLLREKEPNQPNHKYVHQSTIWKIIGMDRLSLCYVAAGNPVKALEVAKESQEIQRLKREKGEEDPTVRGYSLYFYGNALWANGFIDEAKQEWSSKPGMCGPGQAFGKEPAAEHTEYVRQMAKAGADFTNYDEQGFSALDYATLSDNPDAKEMIEIIVNDSFRPALREMFESYRPSLSDAEIEQRIHSEIEMRRAQANLRRFYRTILQEEIRPELRKERRNSVQNVRQIYANSLANDVEKRATLDWFYYVDYNDFKILRRLPLADEYRPGTTERWARKVTSQSEGIENRNLFIIFFSYRWIGATSVPRLDGPDNISNTQYNRMLKALELFLEENSHLDADNVGIWLDCACISQQQPDLRERGINSLPLAVTQCDAMISLVDDAYYSRAWCSVETMLVRELQESYKLHNWWEHILLSPTTDPLSGMLRRGNTHQVIDISTQQLSKEELDRPKVEFLMRQSKLLGKDSA